MCPIRGRYDPLWSQPGIGARGEEIAKVRRDLGDQIWAQNGSIWPILGPNLITQVWRDSSIIWIARHKNWPPARWWMGASLCCDLFSYLWSLTSTCLCLHQISTYLLLTLQSSCVVNISRLQSYSSWEITRRWDGQLFDRSICQR